MQYVYVGRINGTHGLKGELKVKTDFKYKDSIFVEGFNFYVGSLKVHVVLKKIRSHNNNLLLTFYDREDINLVEDLRSNNLYISKDDLFLNDNENVFEDYINLNCYYNDICIGKVIDICDCGSGNYVLVIKGKSEILVPLKDNFIENIVKNDRIVLKEVEGFINEN